MTVGVERHGKPSPARVVRGSGATRVQSVESRRQAADNRGQVADKTGQGESRAYAAGGVAGHGDNPIAAGVLHAPRVRHAIPKRRAAILAQDEVCFVLSDLYTRNFVACILYSNVLRLVSTTLIYTKSSTPHCHHHLHHDHHHH
jgi:hypothetical protein